MRISLFGGPSSGKSTTAAHQFAKAKTDGYSIELVSEYVKAWAISKREVVGYDQIYLLGKQCHYEYRFLSNGIKNIITDSPVLLAACYTREYFQNLQTVADHMEGIVLEYEKQHPALNIFLERKDKPYKTEGRYQTEEEARKLDLVIKDTLDRLEMPYISIPYNNSEEIYNVIKQNLD